tara:strand:- start:1146 stop:1928 length:783 start_codon:yes stop_codon:yes gene_type:complete
MGIEKQIADQFNLLVNECFKILRENISARKITKEVFICTLYVRTIQYSKGIGILLEKKNFVSIVPLFRSSLEALVDISNLCDYEDYADYLTLQSLKRKKEGYSKWYKNKSNPFFPNIEDISDDYKLVIKQVKSDLKELKKKDFDFIKENKELSIRNKFELAGLENVYESIYDLNSTDNHNDFSSLASKHLEEKENKELIINLENKDGLARIIPHILTLSGLLIESLDQLFNKFEKDFKGFRKVLKKENSKLKELVDLNSL